MPAYSFGEAVAWFRFPLFAMATAFWLGRDARLLYLMIFSTGIGVVIMCGILTAEVIIVGFLQVKIFQGREGAPDRTSSFELLAVRLLELLHSVVGPPPWAHPSSTAAPTRSGTRAPT